MHTPFSEKRHGDIGNESWTCSSCLHFGVQASVNKRNVQAALTTNNLFADIQGALTVGAVTEFLELWDLIAQVTLQPGV